MSKGLLATVLVIALALSVATSLNPEWLGSWGSLFFNAMVPTQIVISLFWGGQYPKRIAGLGQPWRGLAFCAITVLAGLAVGTLALYTVGGGISPPTPLVIMYLILAVPVTLWLVVPFQGWPLRLLFKDQGALGFALLLGSYLLAYFIYRNLFNFSFAAGAPFYRAELDPGGLFPAWIPLVLSLISLVLILVLVLFEFWPVQILARPLPKFGNQPYFGIASAALIGLLSWTTYELFMHVLGYDIVVFMARICVPEIFGIFILLVMLDGVPSLKLSQPLRGISLTLTASLLAALMYQLYQAIALKNFPFASGAPAYELELWLAPSMLAITFPLMVTFAAYFQLWPLKRDQPDR